MCDLKIGWHHKTPRGATVAAPASLTAVLRRRGKCKYSVTNFVNSSECCFALIFIAAAPFRTPITLPFFHCDFSIVICVHVLPTLMVLSHPSIACSQSCSQPCHHALPVFFMNNALTVTIKQLEDLLHQAI